MEKRVVQDIVPSNNRVPRESFPIRKMNPERERTIEPERIREVSKEKMIEEKFYRRPEPAFSQQPPKKRKKIWGTLLTFLIIFICLAVIAIAFSLLYSKAVVSITPQEIDFKIDGTFTAKKDASAPTLAYDVLTFSDSASQTINATDGPQIETKAKGTLTLYNEQSAQQKIIAGSRLGNSSGQVYRTLATVVIPAAASSGGKISATSVAVAVLADKAGAEYNMTASAIDATLKFIAFKGTPRYDAVYSRIKSDVTGGFSGSKKIISPEAQKQAVLKSEDALKVSLQKKIESSVPKDYVLYKPTYQIEYEIGDPTTKSKDVAEIPVKATIFGAIFKKDALIKFIAKKELEKFPSPTYSIMGMEDLNLSVVNTKDFSLKKSSPLIFALKGSVSMVGTFSDANLKNDLKGTYLKQSSTVFAKYPAIANAYALVTPFWMRSFPKSPDKITVEIKKP